MEYIVFFVKVKFSMKMIHCADIHLGAKLNSKYSYEVANVLKSEILKTFSEMIDYANENGIHLILMSGDVFDKDKPTIKDKDYFYKLVKNNPHIDFLYLKGNHDKEGAYIENEISNLKTFKKNEITTYEYGDINISGIEISPDNEKSFYSQISLKDDKINIFMLHGEVNINELKNKNIDYLALGHLHSFKRGRIDDRGEWAYSGCLVGRGFDECGEKGFIVLDVGEKVDFDFLKFAHRTIYDLNIDITGASDLFDTEMTLKQVCSDIGTDNLLRINLIGDLSVGMDINEKDIEMLLSSYFFIEVKDKTNLKINVSDYNDDKSLLGEFVRGIYNNNNYTEEEKHRLISMGLKALTGREME